MNANASDQSNDDPSWRPQSRIIIENRRNQVEQQRNIQQINPGYPLVVVLLLLFLLFGGSAEPYFAREQLKSTLDALVYQSSNYSAWLNGTDSDFTLLPTDHSVFSLLDILLQPEELRLDPYSYYRNVSGFLHGPVKIHNLSNPEQLGWVKEAEAFFNATQTNQTELLYDLGNFNWSAAELVTISIQEHSPLLEDVVIIHGSTLFSISDGGSNEMRFEGVHFPDSGSFYAFAEAKLESHLIDLRQLPSIVPIHLQNETSQVVNLEYIERVKKMRNLIKSDSVDIETHDTPADTHCHFQIYGQLTATSLSDFEMRLLEEEIETPTGAHTPPIPPLIMDTVLLSKNCGLLYKASGLKGIQTRIFWREATTYAGVAFLAYLALLSLFVKQTKYASSRRALSRLSWCTFLIQAIADALVFSSHSSLGIIEENRASLSLLGPGFLACLLLINESQLVGSIRQIQSPESADTTGIIQSIAEFVTNIPGLSYIIGAYSRLYFLTVLVLTAFIYSIYISHTAFWIAGAMYSSLWWPQIIRSARRHYRKPLLKKYVLGTTLLRMCFILYFFGYPVNVIASEKSPWVWAFVAQMMLQVIVLVLQEYIGPSFFLPFGWWKELVHDYHPIMSLPDSESPEQSLGDCSICMDPIYVQPDSNDETPARLKAVANRRSYAVAPCDHLFHTRCLERWMTVKGICPQCRRGLPAL